MLFFFKWKIKTKYIDPRSVMITAYYPKYTNSNFPNKIIEIKNDPLYFLLLSVILLL